MNQFCTSASPIAHSYPIYFIAKTYTELPQEFPDTLHISAFIHTFTFSFILLYTYVFTWNLAVCIKNQIKIYRALMSDSLADCIFLCCITVIIARQSRHSDWTSARPNTNKWGLLSVKRKKSDMKKILIYCSQ